MDIKRRVQKITRKFGYQVSKYPSTTHPSAQMRRLLAAHGIDLVLDVGANVGQFGRYMRRDVGYSGRIISFEPQSAAFGQLRKESEGDPLWDVYNFALGESEGRAELLIAGNSGSSSLLTMLPLHIKAAPDSAYVGSEMVEVKRLDAIFDSLCDGATRIFLKVDTQGFELPLLRGGAESLQRIDLVQLEMLLSPLYRDAALFGELHDFMEARDFHLISLLPGFTDPATGRLLQVDGVYRRAASE